MKVAASLAWVCNRPRYRGVGVEPHWIKSCGAGVTHHLPGLQLDEGWLCSNMVHKRLWHCLAAGLDLLMYGVSITRYVVNLLSVARHPINYLLSVTLIYQGDTGTLLFRAWRIPPSGVPSYGCFQFFCQLPSNLCVFHKGQTGFITW